MAYERLKEEMERQHITGYKIAKTIGATTSDVYSALRGTKPMYPKYKLGICKLLGKTMEELFPGEEVTDADMRNYEVKEKSKTAEPLTKDDIKEAVLAALEAYFKKEAD